jgi:hypothetical protein
LAVELNYNLDGLFVALLDSFLKRRDRMSTFADPDLQARILREIRELYEKRAKLEAGIRAIDIAIHLRMEEDASFDIDAYRAVNSRSQTL